MKRLAIIFIFFLILLNIFVFISSLNSRLRVEDNHYQIKPSAETIISPSSAIKNEVIRWSIFVPYWQIGDKVDEKYDRLIYFGVAVSREGIDITDEGYRRLEAFRQMSAGKESYLTLRMFNNELNYQTLADPKLQERISWDLLSLARRYDFSGIVVDMEMSGLPVVDFSYDFNEFIGFLADKCQGERIKLAITLYGDTFYRRRAYDVAVLAQQADEIMIMAYDFSKAYGEPGPNFPFVGKEFYGYDFSTMLADFLRVVPADKLTVIFGMYGYDWTIGEGGKPLKQAQAVTLAQAKKRLFSDSFPRERDSRAGELRISYRDNRGDRHVVWLEDELSTAKKEEYAKTKGINSFAYWAFNYF